MIARIFLENVGQILNNLWIYIFDLFEWIHCDQSERCVILVCVWWCCWWFFFCCPFDSPFSIPLFFLLYLSFQISFPFLNFFLWFYSYAAQSIYFVMQKKIKAKIDIVNESTWKTIPNGGISGCGGFALVPYRYAY